MKLEDAEEYTQSLGQIVAGSWRQIVLAKRLGVPKALGLSVDDWVSQRLGGYIRLSISDRREAVNELIEEGMSQRAIGEVLGVDHMTVAHDLKAGENSPRDTNETTDDAEPNRSTGENSPLAENNSNNIPLSNVTPEEKTQQKERAQRQGTMEVLYKVHTLETLFSTGEVRSRVSEILRNHGDEYARYARLNPQETVDAIRRLHDGIEAWLKEWK